MASDVVTISGPEYQVPQAVDEFLGMVPESHEISLRATPQLREFLKSAEFEQDLRPTLKNSYEVDLEVRNDSKLENMKLSEEPEPEAAEERLLLQYTRNNAGGLKDAIDFLVSRLISQGLDASTVKGAIPRPKSDSFEDSLPFFDSKLLHNAPTPLGTDSPTRSTFGDDVSDRGSLFGKIRKPGSISSISSYFDRRKNQSNSPGSFFKQASANASRASLISMESRDSGYRNPWNDSGINLPEGEEAFTNGGWPLRFENKSEQKLPFHHGLINGDMTPRYDPRMSHDSGRPSTSHSTNGYPAPIGSHRSH
ncbi:uncharacterized protein KY384_007397 [Bacidia gigantensis]|uniref:uncharacterized protein n=1 Tax=Bacidia gigantensis TaxID=2732470 RepID=UPI001D056186|nr:uncharacterized protein KY384_007397 [Bacidia gigantensis]KAG8528479.1 hypothetical protein KY384_007397 [Bacidia gigantensis]